MPSRKAPRPKPKRRPAVRILFTRISDYDRRAACLVQSGMRLAPDPLVTPDDVERGKPALVKDAAWASLVGSLYGGGVPLRLAPPVRAPPPPLRPLSAAAAFAPGAPPAAGAALH